MARWIVSGAPKSLFCKKLTRGRLVLFADAIKDAGAALHCCVEFVDGTNRETCRPSIFQRVFYSGHKHYHSIKFQSWCTLDGLITHLYGPVAGSKHDMYMYHTSNLESVMSEEGFRDFCLFADQGYRRVGHLMSPFRTSYVSLSGKQVKKTLEPLQHMFNEMMLQPRLSVEHAFARVTQLFPYFQRHTSLRIHGTTVAAHYVCAVYFTNMRTCIDGRNQITDNFGAVSPPSLEQYLSYFVTPSLNGSN